MNSNQVFKQATRLVALGAMLVGLAACGGTKSEKKAGQAVATVNDAELTVHQLNGELQDMPAVADPARREQVTKQALESLIDRQLLVTAALDAKLDRDPAVMQSIERSRAQILAQSYLQRQLSAAAVQPTPQQLEVYFTQNPQFFSDRKLFQMNQLGLAQKDYSEEVKRAAEAAHSLDEVAAWLDARKVPYARAQAERTTADLPQQLVPDLDELGRGKPFVVRDGAQVVVATLHFVREVPVSKQDALPQIERFLANSRARGTATSTIASLRAGAKIRYLNGAPSDASAMPIAAPTPPAEVPGAAAGRTSSVSDSIGRGVAGLN